jgi:hypothetical protein
MYPGSKYVSKSKDYFNTKDDQTYFEILDKFSDKIILEIYGHDHFGDLRYHTNAAGVNNHNFMVTPGMTPNKKQNPGSAVINFINNVPQSPKFVFLDLEKTYGMSSVPAASALHFLEV